MVNYKCIRCGYTTDHRSKMKSHLNRKNMCKSILNDINIKIYIDDILDGKEIDLAAKCQPNVSQLSQNGSQMSAICQPNVSQLSQNNYYCSYCNKYFKHRQSLSKHLKNRCKEKEIDDAYKNDMLELVNRLNDQLNKKDKQIEDLIKKVGITQNIQNNIQNNIKILAYKNTDISHLTDQDYLKCISHSNFCVPQLIKKIHFDPEKPENHNIYISNIRNRYIMTYDGKKWNLNNQDETIDDLIDTNEFFIEQKLEEWIENGKAYPEIMKKFNRYLEKKEQDDILNKIKDEIKLLLYNNRKVVNDQLEL